MDTTTEDDRGHFQLVRRVHIVRRRSVVLETLFRTQILAEMTFVSNCLQVLHSSTAVFVVLRYHGQSINQNLFSEQ